MSTVKELADAEAEAVEAELGPDNPDAEPEVEEEEDAQPEPEPDEPSSLELVQEMAKKIGAEAKRHENALAKLRPDDWDQHVMCPLCIGDGYLLPIPPGKQPDEIWEAIRALSGRVDSGALKPAPFAELCEVCGGTGQVDTGASSNTMPTPACRECAGYGWLDLDPPSLGHPPAPNAKKLPPVGGTHTGQLYPVPAPAEPWPDHHLSFIPVPGGVPDPWNRPAGHPRWGSDTTEAGAQLAQPAPRGY